MKFSFGDYIDCILYKKKSRENYKLPMIVCGAKILKIRDLLDLSYTKIKRKIYIYFLCTVDFI